MFKSYTLSIKVAIGLLFLLGITNIFLSYISLTAPIADHSEFAALKNVATGLYALLIAILSVFLVVMTIVLIKGKRWAYILTSILVLLIFLLLEVSDLKHVLVLNLSLNKEILPVFILILLAIGYKNFWKK